jgi:hypothetical protein
MRNRFTLAFTKKAFRSLGIALSCVVYTASTQATVIPDIANDFIPSFTGIKNPAIDVISTSATFDGTNFHIGATLAGPISAFPSALYVFGFNRGAATANFAAIGLPGVVFDSVITLTGAGVTGGRDLVANAPIVLPPGAAQISGSSFQIDFAASLLPSQGLQPLQYGINLWPRDSSQPAGNGQISDFAPDATVFTASLATNVPEPEVLSLLLIGLAGFGATKWRRH